MPNALPTPDWAAKRCTELGGLNPFGGPNFRVVWGGTRTHKVGGFFKTVIEGKAFDIPEVRELLKYHPERWHLEKWCSPEIYGSQEAWYRDTWDELAKVHTCGDYPATGDYEHVFFLAECPHFYSSEASFLAQHPLPERGKYFEFSAYTEAIEAWQAERLQAGIGEWCQLCKVTMGHFIPLEENFYLIETQIRAFQMSEYVSEREEREARFKEQHDERMAARNRAEAIVRNRMMAFGTIPHSYSTDPNRRCSVPDARFNPRLFQPLGRNSFQQSNNALPAKKQAELENVQ